MKSTIIFSISAFIYMTILMIVFFTKKYYKSLENKIYSKIIITSFIGLIVEILGVFIFESNNSLLIFIQQKLYQTYLLTWIGLFTLYTIISFKDKKEIKSNLFIILFYVISVIIIFILPTEIYNKDSKIFTYGASINYVYFFSLICIFIIVYKLLTNIKKIFNKKYIPISLFIFIGVVTMFIQSINPAILLTSSMEALITFLMYFTIENPDIKLMTELVVAKDIAERSKNETINTLNSITYKLNEEKNKLNNINIDKNNIEKESKKLQLFYNNLLNEINDLIELGKINSSSYKIEEELYDLEEVLDKLNDLINVQNNNVKVSYNKEYNKILYGDYKKILLLILYMINYLSNKIEDSNIKLDVSLIEVNNICKLKFNFSVLEKYKNNYMYYDKFTKENYLIKDNDYRIIINLLKKLEGKLIIKDNNIIISLYQKVSNNLKLSNETNNKKVIKINSNNKKILLVDDNNKKLKIISELLNKYNINTDTINDYDELSSALLNSYGLILVDDIMPKIDNLSNEEVLRKYSTKMIQRINGINIPVVIMLTNNDVINSNNYSSYGYDDYILKTINDKTIKELINKYFKY